MNCINLTKKKKHKLITKINSQSPKKNSSFVFKEPLKFLRPDIFDACVKVNSFLGYLIKVFHASHIRKAFAYTAICVDSYIPYPF